MHCDGYQNPDNQWVFWTWWFLVKNLHLDNVGGLVAQLFSRMAKDADGLLMNVDDGTTSGFRSWPWTLAA